MNHPFLTACWIVPLVAAAVPAQVVTSTLTALTPIVAEVQSAAQTAQASQPVGPLPPSGSIEANLLVGGLGPFAQVGWFADANTTAYSRAGIAHDLESVGAPVTLSVAPHEILVHFTATTTVSVQIELQRWSGLSVGAPHPQVAIDLGNDGTIDWNDLPAGLPQLSAAVIGAAGYDVRVILGATVQGPGYSTTTLSIAAHADNALNIALDALGCATTTSPSPYQFEPIAVFADSGVDLLFDAGGVPSVIVLGLGLQPLLLPTNFGAACLVTPSRDAVLAIPFSQYPLHIPLPAAVRPVTLRSQAVGLTPTGLATTDAWRIRAF